MAGGCVAFPEIAVPEEPGAGESAVNAAVVELPLTVEDLAGQALMSPRTYARRFREATGSTPLQWLCRERVGRAQDLLENTDDTIDRIATRCGFGSAHRLRTHFTRVNRVTPHEYQRTFRTRAAA